MNGIFGMTELALETNLSADQREYLEAVKSSADSLMTIINDILDFSKIEAQRIELEKIPFHLRDTVHAAVAGVSLLAEKKDLELAYSIPGNVPDGLIGDPGRFRQVLTNLLSNAIKFTNKGEVVASIDVVQRTNNRVRLKVAVKDTGIGIPPEKRRLIFEAFAQADTSTTRVYGGTGLGLTISTQLVALMNGTLDVESELGKGCDVLLHGRVRPPRGRQQGRHAAPPGRSEGPAGPDRRRQRHQPPHPPRDDLPLGDEAHGGRQRRPRPWKPSNRPMPRAGRSG